MIHLFPNPLLNVHPNLSGEEENNNNVASGKNLHLGTTMGVVNFLLNYGSFSDTGSR